MKVLSGQLDHGLFTKNGIEWLYGLNLDSAGCYLRVLASLDDEIKLLLKELVGITEDDWELKLLMTILGISCYSAVLMKSEIGNIDWCSFDERLCSYAGLVPSIHASGKTVYHGGSLRRKVDGCVGLCLKLLRLMFTSMTRQ
jgi:transposase